MRKAEPDLFESRTSRWLLALLIFLVAANMWWAGPQGGCPQHWDSAIHLSESINAGRMVKLNEGVSITGLLNVSWYYPPFVSYASIPFYKVFGESVFTGCLITTFFLIVLIVSVYFLGKFLYWPTAGLLAAILVASYPIVIEYSRIFMLDLPLMAMVALFVLLLLRSENFKNVDLSIAAGVVFGLGELTKWTFVYFVIYPLGRSCWIALRARKDRKKRFLTMAGAGLAALLVAAPWYLVHIVQILTSRGGELARGNYTLLQTVFLYLREMPGETSWIGFAFLLVGIAAFFTGGRKWGGFLGLWFLSGYVLVSATGIKAPRFAMSLLIPVTLLAASGLESLQVRWKEKLVRWGGIRTIVIALASLELLAVLFIPAGSSPGQLLTSPVLGEPFISVQGAGGTDWDNTRALRMITNDMERSGKTRAVVRVIPDHPYFNNSTASCCALLHDLPLQITGTSGFPMFTDYVLLKTGNLGIDSPDRHRTKLTSELMRGYSGDSTAYHAVDSLTLPDGSEAIIIKVVPARATMAATQTILKDIREVSNRWIERYFKPLGEYSLELEEYDTVQTALGLLKGIHLQMANAEFGDFAFNPNGIPVSNLDAEVTDVIFNPKSLVDHRTLEVFSIGGLEIRGIRIRSSDVMAYLMKAPPKGLEIKEIAMKEGTLSVQGVITRYNTGIELGIRLFLLKDKNIRFRIQRARIGSVPLPVSLLNVMTDAYNPVIRGLDNIEDVTIGPIKVENDEMRIGPGPGN